MGQGIKASSHGSPSAEPNHPFSRVCGGHGAKAPQAPGHIGETRGRLSPSPLARAL